MNTIVIASQPVAFDVTSVVAQLSNLFSRRRIPIGTKTLDGSSAVHISHPLGRRITCVSGSLWLTFDGEREDAVLEAGQSMLCAHHTPLLVSAFGRAVVHAD